MTGKVIYTSLISVILLVLWDGAGAQSGCTTAIVSLSPCLNYVTGNSSTPTSSCCSSLSSVVQSQPQCLCTLLKGGSSNLGFAINQTQALALPGACNVQTPPVSQCDAGNGPAAAAPRAPAPVAADSPSDTPTDEMPDADPEPDVPSGTGSKTVPSTEGASSGGSNNGATFSFVGTLALVFASCAFSGI